MKHYTYMTEGVCSSQIDFDLDGTTIHNIVFTNGCHGNLKAIGRLCEGKDAKEIADILRGNTCGPKPTSCADQLSKALEAALSN